jgi:hypothetical protein
MTDQAYKCDLCKRAIPYPSGGYKLSGYKDGEYKILLLPLDSGFASESAICLTCVKQIVDSQKKDNHARQ